MDYGTQQAKNTYSGTYLLVLHLRKGREIDVGRMGAIFFPRGYYLYVGSAFGPGGLNARIGRHLRSAKKHHWHIDYLASASFIIDVWFSGHEERYECRWANILAGASGLSRPVPGFGSSDCSCRSHLIHSKRKPLVAGYRDLLGAGLMRWKRE